MSHHAGDGCEREFGPGVHNLGATPRAAVAGEDARAEELRRLCEKAGRYEIGALPAHPDARAEARQQIAKWLFTRFDGRAVTSWHEWWASTEAKCWLGYADALLDTPVVAEALGLRARIEHLAKSWTRYPQSAEERESNRYGAAMQDCGDALRRALDAS